MHVSFFPRLYSKEVTHHQYLYKTGTSNSEEILRRQMRKSKNTEVNVQGQMKSMLVSEKLRRSKLCLDLIGPYNM